MLHKRMLLLTFKSFFGYLHAQKPVYSYLNNFSFTDTSIQKLYRPVRIIEMDDKTKWLKIMKPSTKISFYLKGIWLLLFCTSATLLFAQSKKNKHCSIVISNTQSFERKNEVLHIKRSILKNFNSDVFTITNKNNKVVASQLIDTDNNGIWDELLLEVNLLPHTKDTLTVMFGKARAFPSSTSVRLSLKSKTGIPSNEISREIRTRGFKQNIADPYYQMEGPGIENDKIAFRSFFDYRNGKDIYGKIVDTPILKQVGVKGVWHNMQPWGMDILKVGNSLGAGALAVKENNQLIRLGDADSTIFSTSYQGALAAAFKLQFSNWDVGTNHQNGAEKISIDKSDFFYKNEINLPLTIQQNLVAGMANFINAKIFYTKHNAAFSSIATYGKQAEGTDSNLGLAILFATKDYIQSNITAKTDPISNTAYVVLYPTKNNKQTIYFFACWEQTDTRFATQQGFENYVNETANKLANPIKIISINKN